MNCNKVAYQISMLSSKLELHQLSAYQRRDGIKPDTLARRLTTVRTKTSQARPPNTQKSMQRQESWKEKLLLYILPLEHSTQISCSTIGRTPSSICWNTHVTNQRNNTNSGKQPFLLITFQTTLTDYLPSSATSAASNRPPKKEAIFSRLEGYQ